MTNRFPKAVLPWILLLTVLLMLGNTAAAEDESKADSDKQKIRQEWVTVQHGDREVRCLLTIPVGKEKAPAVLVIHEIFGLSDWAQGLTRQVAEAGYIAIAPDLLSGMGPKNGDTRSFEGRRAAMSAVRKLPQAQVTADLDAVAKFALKQSTSNGKLAVAGFCWGGRQTFQYATHRPTLAGAFVFYGTPPKETLMKKIACPVYGFYGGTDKRVNGTIPAATSAMEAAGKKYTPVIYEGARHGFMRTGESPKGSAADKKAREEAWIRWKKLLEEMESD